jgi:hypothetical protein
MVFANVHRQESMNLLKVFGNGVWLQTGSDMFR